MTISDELSWTIFDLPRKEVDWQGSYMKGSFNI